MTYVATDKLLHSETQNRFWPISWQHCTLKTRQGQGVIGSNYLEQDDYLSELSLKVFICSDQRCPNWGLTYKGRLQTLWHKENELSPKPNLVQHDWSGLITSHSLYGTTAAPLFGSWVHHKDTHTHTRISWQGMLQAVICTWYTTGSQCEQRRKYVLGYILEPLQQAVFRLPDAAAMTYRYLQCHTSRRRTSWIFWSMPGISRRVTNVKVTICCPLLMVMVMVPTTQYDWIYLGPN